MNKISTIYWWRDYKHVHLAEHVSKNTSEKRSKNPLSWVVRYSQAPGDMSQPESNRCLKESQGRSSERFPEVLSGIIRSSEWRYNWGGHGGLSGVACR
jgi:hypothetical protein